MHRPQGGPIQQHLQPNTASPRDQANIDPAISGAMMSAAPQTPTQQQQSSPDDITPKSYGKRELSTSKRAAQNRAAQVCGGRRASPFPLSETQLMYFTACFPPAQGNLYSQAGS
jgi:hypothetical protein